MGSKIEAIFGGVLVLFVIIAAVAAILSFPGSGPDRVARADGDDRLGTIELIKDTDKSLICQCYDAGFDLAGSNVDVMSSQYRTGYEQCRALGEAKGAKAWTDGWNARLSARPYEASCRSYKRKKQKAL